MPRLNILNRCYIDYLVKLVPFFGVFYNAPVRAPRPARIQLRVEARTTNVSLPKKCCVRLFLRYACW